MKGNLGTGLDSSIYEMQTYFSRDAGLNWKVLYPE